MEKLEEIAEKIRQTFDDLNESRDMALSQSRMLIRHCSQAIRAVHREDTDGMNDHLEEAGELARTLTTGLKNYPNLYHTGYTQDALKEYAEAKITCALILNKPLPSPEEINVIHATWLKGLSEVVGELRRRCLDLLRQGYSSEAERLLGLMDDIYSVLVTMDYPDAITHGLRRQTDIARSIIERTRGDLTFSLQGEHLATAISSLSLQILQEEDRKEEPKQ
jgi:translin